MSIQIKTLRNEMRWNVIPLLSFERSSSGAKKVQFLNSYAQYHTKLAPEEMICEKYNHYAIICGITSNLIILDIDSEEALLNLCQKLSLTKESLFESAKFLVRTSKGYQLFYTYDSEIKSKIGILEGIDLLSDGRLTFALPCNEGYNFLKKEKPEALPLCMKNFFLSSTTVDRFSSFTEKRVKDFFSDPLAPYLEKYLRLKTTPKDLRTYLENRLLGGLTFKEAKKPGRRHNLALSAASICKQDPTVSLDLYYRFCHKFIGEVICPDEDILKIVDYKLDQFDYDEHWLGRVSYTEQLEGAKIMEECQKFGFYIFRDGEKDKWATCKILNDSSLRIDYYGVFARLKERMLQECGGNEPLKKLTTSHVETRVQRFDPDNYEVNNPFQINALGEKIVNTFVPSVMMQYYKECRDQNISRKMLPDLIGKVLCNVIPDDVLRKLFLHNLAFFLHTYMPSQTAFVCIGKTQGTGKGTLFDIILGKYLFGINFSVRRDTHAFLGPFNGELENKLFLHGNDIKEKFSPHNTTTFVNAIKNIVAEPVLSIHAKGKERKNVNNYLFTCISSNETCPFKLDSSDNRRFVFSKTTNIKLESIFDADEFLNRNEIIKAEMPYFIEYLAGVTLNEATYRSQIKNEAYYLAVEESRSPAETIAEALIEHDLGILEEYSSDLSAWVKVNIAHEGLNLASIPVTILKEMLGSEMCRLVGKELRARGVEKRLMHLKSLNKTGSGYIINKKGSNVEHLKPLKQEKR